MKLNDRGSIKEQRRSGLGGASIYVAVGFSVYSDS